MNEEKKFEKSFEIITNPDFQLSIIFPIDFVMSYYLSKLLGFAKEQLTLSQIKIGLNLEDIFQN